MIVVPPSSSSFSPLLAEDSSANTRKMRICCQLLTTICSQLFGGLSPLQLLLDNIHCAQQHNVLKSTFFGTFIFFWCTFAYASSEQVKNNQNNIKNRFSHVSTQTSGAKSTATGSVSSNCGCLVSLLHLYLFLLYSHIVLVNKSSTQFPQAPAKRWQKWAHSAHRGRSLIVRGDHLQCTNHLAAAGWYQRLGVFMEGFSAAALSNNSNSQLSHQSI